MDGGLIANNPTLDALTEIQEYNLALRAKGRESEAYPVSIVVSLGTGLIPVTQSNVSKMLPDSIWEGAKLVFGISALVSLLVDQVIFILEWYYILFCTYIELLGYYG